MGSKVETFLGVFVKGLIFLQRRRGDFDCVVLFVDGFYKVSSGVMSTSFSYFHLINKKSSIYRTILFIKFNQSYLYSFVLRNKFLKSL